MPLKHSKFEIRRVLSKNRLYARRKRWSVERSAPTSKKCCKSIKLHTRLNIKRLDDVFRIRQKRNDLLANRAKS